VSHKTDRRKRLKRHHTSNKQKKSLKKRQERNEVKPIINEIRQEAKSIAKRAKKGNVVSNLLRSVQAQIKQVVAPKEKVEEQ